MIRNLAITAVLATAIAHPALAQTTTVAPVAPAISATEAPATTTPAPAAETMPIMILTQQEAEAWIGKSVYSRDGKDLGEVAAFTRGDDNAVMEMHADIGGFLGFGKHRISLTPEQFDLNDDRATLVMSSLEANKLPAIVE